MFVWTALTGGVATYLTVSKDLGRVVLSMFGPAVTLPVMLLLLLASPALAGGPNLGRVQALTLPLVFAVLHLCAHVALTANPSGPFSRLELLPGAAWQQPGLWLVSYSVTAASLLAASSSRGQRGNQ